MIFLFFSQTFFLYKIEAIIYIFILLFKLPLSTKLKDNGFPKNKINQYEKRKKIEKNNNALNLQSNYIDLSKNYTCKIARKNVNEVNSISIY